MYVIIAIIEIMDNGTFDVFYVSYIYVCNNPLIVKLYNTHMYKTICTSTKSANAVTYKYIKYFEILLIDFMQAHIVALLMYVLLFQ